MRHPWFVALLAGPLFSGCVMKGTYEAKEAELASCRAESAQTLDLLAETREGAEAEMAAARRELDQCVRDAKAARGYAQKLDERERNLREKLKTEVESRDVEISRLRDQLSVRVLDRILFRSGSAQILPEGQAVLEKLARVLVDTDDMIRVEGHTDSVPIGERLKARYPSNWELSGARASSVVRYFEHAHKIDPVRMEPVGFSKFRPVAPGQTPEDLRRNRRVEIVLTAPKAPLQAQPAP